MHIPYLRNTNVTFQAYSPWKCHLVRDEITYPFPIVVVLEWMSGVTQPRIYAILPYSKQWPFEQSQIYDDGFWLLTQWLQVIWPTYYVGRLECVVLYMDVAIMKTDHKVNIELVRTWQYETQRNLTSSFIMGTQINAEWEAWIRQPV